MRLGKVSGNALKRSILGQVKHRREEVASGAGLGADCAIFSLAGEATLVSCVQEAAVSLAERTAASSEEGAAASWQERTAAPLEEGKDMLAGGGPGRKAEPYMTMAQLIQKCANNLAAGGAAPMAVTAALILPESTEEQEIKALMMEAEQKCEELSIELAGGQTRITCQVSGPLAVVTGYGRAGAEGYRTIQMAAPGQELVISKWIGLQGTALLAKRNRAGLLCRYPAYFIEEAAGFDRYLSVIPEAAAAVKSGVCAMHDVSEGGIFAALWELAEGAGVGLDIDMRKLPLRQETVEVCEYCNVNPYELLSGGCLMMTTYHGQALAAALEAEHIPAVSVGRLTEGKDRILRNGEEIRYLDRPRQDQIYGGGY